MMSTRMAADEIRYNKNALNYYGTNLRQMVESEVPLPEIQEWLHKRNIEVPDKFLENFLKQFDEEPENDNEKVIISTQGEAARIQNMDISEIEEKDSLSELNPKKDVISCPVCGSTDYWKNGKSIKGEQRLKCKVCQKQFLRPARKDDKKSTVVDKYCPKCNEIKPAEEFNKNSNSGDGLQKVCRECQTEYNIEPNLKKGYKLYPLLRIGQLSRDNKPFTIDDIKTKFKKETKVKYNLILNALVDAGYLGKKKDGKKNIYWILDFDKEIPGELESKEVKNEIPQVLLNLESENPEEFRHVLSMFAQDKSVDEVKAYLLEQHIYVESFELITFKEDYSRTINAIRNGPVRAEEIEEPENVDVPNYIEELESKKDDLIRMCAYDISKLEIHKWLEDWNIKVSYDALLEFENKYANEILILKSKIKAAFESKISKDTVITPVNDLPKLFNMPNTVMTINATNQETFFQACTILNNNEIDFNIYSDSTENKYEIVIPGEEDE